MSSQHSTDDNASVPTGDWRLTMFGDSIVVNKTSFDEEVPIERPPELVATIEAFDTTKYDYIAVFIGADYCPHCKVRALPRVGHSQHNPRRMT